MKFEVDIPSDPSFYDSFDHTIRKHVVVEAIQRAVEEFDHSYTLGRARGLSGDVPGPYAGDRAIGTWSFTEVS